MIVILWHMFMSLKHHKQIGDIAIHQEVFLGIKTRYKYTKQTTQQQSAEIVASAG